MKTSKVKEIVRVKDWLNKKTGKTTYYHHLVMENGDKIDIGKQSKMEIGTDMNYEIFDTQYEFHKARAVWNQTGGFKSNDNRQESIVRQSSLKCATEYLKGAEASLEELFETAEKMIEWVNKTTLDKIEVSNTAKQINDFAKDPMNIKKENDDLPF